MSRSGSGPISVMSSSFYSVVTSINIYARLCALLRRCLSMAKTFFHVFNL